MKYRVKQSKDCCSHADNNDDRYTAMQRYVVFLFILLFLVMLLIGLTLLFPQVRSEDTGIFPVSGDVSVKKEVKEGEGSVTMVWTLEAQADLSDGKVYVHFQNPNSSSHDIEVGLYVLCHNEEFLMARSGRIKAGYELKYMPLLSSQGLTEGTYKGIYRITGYDPSTGEKAAYMPEIPDVAVTVIP